MKEIYKPTHNPVIRPSEKICDIDGQPCEAEKLMKFQKCTLKMAWEYKDGIKETHIHEWGNPFHLGNEILFGLFMCNKNTSPSKSLAIELSKKEVCNA